MTQVARSVSPSRMAPAAVPPLQPGDHLSRDEFERRFDAMPDLKFAELIEGKVYMPPPASFWGHGTTHADFLGWLVAYRAATPGVRVSGGGSIRMDLKNMPQPDACMVILPKHGGQARISDDDYVVGAPELVAEISHTTASHDLHEKFQVYLRNGVREYIVWRTFDNELDYFILRSSEFVKHTADAQGRFRSEIFPGLWLDAPSLIKDDLAAVLAFGQEGIASPEHAQFVERLKAAATPK